MNSEAAERITAKDQQPVVCEPAHFKLPRLPPCAAWSVECTIAFPLLQSNIRSEESMKPKLGLEMRPADTQEVQLVCNCCGQPYYPNKSWEDRIRAIIFGAEKYAVCPLCTQAVPDDVLRDEGYRQRCHYEVARLQRMFESESKTHTRKVKRMAEPTYEELKARVAELEKQKRSGSLQFKVSEKGGVSVYGLGRFPVTLYYEQWVRLLDAAQGLRDFLETNKAKLKLKDLK